MSQYVDWDPWAEVFYLFPRRGWKLEVTEHSQSEPWSYGTSCLRKSGQQNQWPLLNLFLIHTFIGELFLILLDFYWLPLCMATLQLVLFICLFCFCDLLSVFIIYFCFYDLFLFLWFAYFVFMICLFCFYDLLILFLWSACFEIVASCEALCNVGLEKCSINKDYYYYYLHI